MKLREHTAGVITLGALNALGAISVCLPQLALAAEQTTAPKTMPWILVQENLEEEISPELTGGDVNVITAEDIEKKHYTSISEAIKRLPGVQVANAGYRAMEYSLANLYGEEISINGDSGVIILVDGRRLDNDASSYGGAQSKSRVSPDTITNISSVERIEVIKGTGAAAFGSEATGGVINIITRQGRDKQSTSLDAAVGSWGRQNYSITQSGPIFDPSFRYFASFTHQTSDDTKYKDAYTDKTQTYFNTSYRDKGASLRLDKDFTENQSLGLYYSWTDNKDHYPITAPDYATLYLMYANALPSSSSAPGYRNWFLYDAWLGSYTRTRSSDVDLKYTFRKKDGLESYVRGYRNFRLYTTKDFGGLFGTQLGNITQAQINTAVTAAGTQRRETVDGGELQLAGKFGTHAVMSGWSYRESELDTLNVSRNTHTLVNRDALEGYLQDKIQLVDRWDFTPGIRYAKFSTIKRTAATGVVTEKGASSDTTFSAYTSYKFDVIGDVYFSWSQIFRPKSNYDYDSEAAVEPLNDEHGQSWTVGISKSFPTDTILSANYALTDMTNANARYSVYDPTVVNTGSSTGFGGYVTRSVNATQKKRGFNFSANQKIGEHWAVTASYAHIFEKFSAKNYPSINPNDVTNINAMINNYRSPNTYQTDLMYGVGKWSTTLTAQLNTGNDTRYFTSRHFTIFGLKLNYDLFKNTQLYLNVDNLTNEAYETKTRAIYGTGAFPQPGRNFMIGVHQKI